MIIKNNNNQNNVIIIIPTTISRPKGWARIPACPQLKCSSPGHSRSWARATSRTEKLRFWEPDSGQRMETETVARMQKITFTPQSQTIRDGDQAADSNGKPSSVVPGRLVAWAAPLLWQGPALCQEVPTLALTSACHFVGKQGHRNWVLWLKDTETGFIRSEKTGIFFFFLWF